MAQNRESLTSGTATASADLARIQPGWTVYDALDRPIGNVTDVGNGELQVDGRPEGLGFFTLRADTVRAVEEGSVRVTIDSAHRDSGTAGSTAAPAGRTGDAEAAFEDTAPIGRAPETTEWERGTTERLVASPARGGRGESGERYDGSSFTASGTPVGLGSNTPVGEEPGGFRAWEDDVERDSAWSKLGWVAAPIGIGAASAAAYVWWRSRQRRRNRLERLTRGLMAAGGSVAPMIEVARDRKGAWWLAALAALPLAYYLRSSDRVPTEDLMPEVTPSPSWRDRLPSLPLALPAVPTALPDEIETPPAWTALIPVAAAGLVGAWFAARRRRRATPEPRRLREIMTRTVEVVRPEATIFEAASAMRRLGVGFLPVCDGRRLQGTLTDRDVVLRTVAESRDPQVATVREAMSSEVVYAFEDDTVERAAALMRQHQIRRLPVVDRGRNLVGVVSLGDLAVEGRDDRLSGTTLERISEPTGR